MFKLVYLVYNLTMHFRSLHFRSEAMAAPADYAHLYSTQQMITSIAESRVNQMLHLKAVHFFLVVWHQTNLHRFANARQFFL